MTASSQDPIAGTPQAPSVVPAGLHCMTCAYDLRGLDPAGRCPECNTSIATSAAYPVLSLAHPAWLHQMRLGLAIDAFSVIPLWLMVWPGIPLWVHFNIPPRLAGAAVIATALCWAVAGCTIGSCEPATTVGRLRLAVLRWLSAGLLIGWLPLAMLIGRIGRDSTSVERFLIAAVAIVLMMQVVRDGLFIWRLETLASRLKTIIPGLIAWVSYLGIAAGQLVLGASALANLGILNWPNSYLYERWTLATWWIGRCVLSVACVDLLRRILRRRS